jgi:hypothetical protein
MVDRSKILPSNVDDPRFSQDSPSDGRQPAEWTARDALVADLTEPIDTASSIATSRFGVAIFLEAAVELVGSLIGALLSHLAPH